LDDFVKLKADEGCKGCKIINIVDIIVISILRDTRSVSEG